ncbi:mucin-5AC-like, partial [Tachysurus ichikawai]
MYVQPYAGQPRGCNAFIMQCLLVFEMKPSQFRSEKDKFAYMVALLSVRALAWATAVWQGRLADYPTVGSFINALLSTFDHPIRIGAMTSSPLRLHQCTLSSQLHY